MTVPGTVVLGCSEMRERGGRTKVMPVISNGARALEQTALGNIEKGSTVHTDEWAGYYRLNKNYIHRTVNHSQEQYVKNGVSTNSIESVFAVLRRGLHGVYHHASEKHLIRYVNEFAWRLNEGMDLHMDAPDDFSPADIKRALGETGSKLIAMSIWQDDPSRELAASFGSFTFLDKSCLATLLIPAIKQSTA